MTAAEQLRETARRLLERDCAEQGVEPIVADPGELAAVAALLRPVRARADQRADTGTSTG